VEIYAITLDESGLVAASLPNIKAQGKAYGTGRKGIRQYELTDHLGNVRAEIGDRLEEKTDENNETAYAPKLLSATDYFPFGMQMPGRVAVEMPEGYRYGFNGMERENTVNEDGYTSTWRQYSSWSARWKGLDPQMRKFPHESPYLAFGANPVFYVDSEGDVKITYYTQTHGDGTVTKFAKVDADYVKHRWVLTKAWGGNYETYGLYAHDVVQHKTLDSESNVTSSGPEILYFRETSAEYLFDRAMGRAAKAGASLDKMLEGNGGTVKGGYYLVTEDGGVNTTKYIAESDAPMKDVTAFLVTAGRTGFAPSLPAVRSPNLQGLPTVANTAKEQITGWSGEADPLNEQDSIGEIEQTYEAVPGKNYWIQKGE
jgi:hypothetical protein